MRKGWILVAFFCVLTLTGCGTVGALNSCRPANGSKELENDLPAYLQKMSGTHVQKEKNGVIVTIPSDSLFQPDAGSVELFNHADMVFLANGWKKFPCANLNIDVFTDCTHSEEKNLVLSELEAWMIKQALISCGVSADRITAQGWGESKPVATNGTAEGRKANRRVTVTFESGKSLAAK
jgi:outer membrane protein OmpA-like peptidoglycan-associated protein